MVPLQQQQPVNPALQHPLCAAAYQPLFLPSPQHLPSFIHRSSSHRNIQQCSSSAYPNIASATTIVILLPQQRHLSAPQHLHFFHLATAGNFPLFLEFLLFNEINLTHTLTELRFCATYSLNDSTAAAAKTTQCRSNSPTPPTIAPATFVLPCPVQQRQQPLSAAAYQPPLQPQLQQPTSFLFQCGSGGKSYCRSN